MVLGEAIGVTEAAAIVLSLAGVCCIAKPEFIFHTSDSAAAAAVAAADGLQQQHADGTAFSHFDAFLSDGDVAADLAISQNAVATASTVPTLSKAQHTLAVAVGKRHKLKFETNLHSRVWGSEYPSVFSI